MFLKQLKIARINHSTNLPLFYRSSVVCYFVQKDLLLLKPEDGQQVVVACDALVVVEDDELVADVEVV